MALLVSYTKHLRKKLPISYKPVKKIEEKGTCLNLFYEPGII